VKNAFNVLVSIDLDLSSLDLKFAPLVTIAQRYVSTKLDVPVVFQFRENRRHGTPGTEGQTDRRGATFNAAPRDGRAT